MTNLPVLLLSAAAVASGGLGCANRGMIASDAGRDRGRPADAPVADLAAESPARDTAVTETATTDTGADTIPDAGAADGHDGPVDRPPASCPARFNFENGAIHGAINNNAADCPSCLKAFTAITSSDAKTFCGYGALEITAAFSGTDGPTTGGEILIPLRADGTPEDLTGKTITIHVSAQPKGTDLAFFLILSTSSGYQTVPSFPVRPVTDQWSTKTATLGADGGVVAGMASVVKLSLEAFSYSGYKGKIYVDEIDIK
jgi:hypothetical protein